MATIFTICAIVLMIALFVIGTFIGYQVGNDHIDETITFYNTLIEEERQNHITTERRCKELECQLADALNKQTPTPRQEVEQAISSPAQGVSVEQKNNEKTAKKVPLKKRTQNQPTSD